MTHQFKAVTDEIVVAGCVLPSPLVPGAVYKFTGLSQGTLGNYTIVAHAVDTDSLDAFVSVFPDGSLSGHAWVGIFDWDTCELIQLSDDLNNDIRGSANISLFPWFNASVSENYISQLSVFTPSPGVIFQNNRIEGASGVDLSLATGAVSLDSVTFNSGSSFSVSGNKSVVVVSSIFEGSLIGVSGTGNFNCSSSHFLDSTSNIGGGGNSTFSGAIVSGSSLDLFQEVNISFVKSSIFGSVLNLTASLSGGNLRTITFNNSIISSGSTIINGAGVLSNNINFNDFSASTNSTLNISGNFSSVTNINNSSIKNSSSLNLLGNNAALTVNRLFAVNNSISNLNQGTQTDVSLEVGTFTNSGFNATRVRLEDSTSTLVANISDATKTGYVNALP